MPELIGTLTRTEEKIIIGRYATILGREGQMADAIGGDGRGMTIAKTSESEKVQ